MCEKIANVETIKKHFKNDMTIMIGGFLGCGTPEKLIDAIVENKISNITIICNDTAFLGIGIGKLIENKLVKKVITSHIGTNQETERQLLSGEIEVDLVPQGSLIERIRCGGYGLGGVLTKTGLGTDIEESRQIVEVLETGEKYLLETPIKADISIIKASISDESGNLCYDGSTVNFNPLMAMAGDVVIAEVDKIVSMGELHPNNVTTPHIFIDYILQGE